MMEMFYNAWEKTCSDVDNEQIFKSNMMALDFNGSDDHLDSKKLIDLVGEEMLIFGVIKVYSPCCYQGTSLKNNKT